MTIVLDGSSGITAPGGTAAAPSITTTGDVNTGIFFPAADTIAFSEGGVESMRIDSSANVGIGTATPGAKLDVNVGGTNNIKLGTASSFGIISLNGSVTTSASMGIFGGATGDVDLYYQNATGGGHRFRVSTTTMAYLDSSGNLGLGVTPSVWGSNRKAIQFGALGCVFSDNNVTSEIGANVYISTAPAYTYITSNFATRYAQVNGQHQWHTAASGTAGNAITFTQALTLNTNGALVLQGGDTAADGVGVTFPASQSASTNANTLDDYEEGSFDPTVTAATPPSGLTYNSRVGRYIKIGRLVHIEISIDVANIGTGGSGTLAIGGLPFTSINVSSNFPNFGIAIAGISASLSGEVTGQINSNSNAINIVSNTNTTSGLSAASFATAANGMNFRVATSYIAAN